mmetsp:Transcript_6092/g.9360  ORF Transcript_6092/g.9360 Transcript_6092/m.9360 type:complete len:305 (+) Transcript_6092:127-1041(+)
MAARSPPPSTVATSFVAHYYRVLSKKPAELFRFYKEESSFTFGAPGEAAEPVTGIEAIKTKITGLGLEGAKVEVGQGSVDAQASRDGGVVMLVTGTIALATGQQPAQAFAQTFFLAPQVVVQQGRTAPVPSYFVLNDTLRFVQPAAAAAALSPPVHLNLPSPSRDMATGMDKRSFCTSFSEYASASIKLFSTISSLPTNITSRLSMPLPRRKSDRVACFVVPSTCARTRSEAMRAPCAIRSRVLACTAYSFRSRTEKSTMAPRSMPTFWRSSSTSWPPCTPVPLASSRVAAMRKPTEAEATAAP